MDTLKLDENSNESIKAYDIRNKLVKISNMIKNDKFTHFFPKVSSLDAKKKWIIGSLNSNGTIRIDDGASKALRNGKSLLAAGITRIDGLFKKGENVIILDQNKIYHKFNWQVEKYTMDGPLKDCWLTTMVSSPIPLGSSI